MSLTNELDSNRLQQLYEDYIRIVTADALINSQYVEKVFKAICALLKPNKVNIEVEDFLSGDPKKTRFTLGQLSRAVQNTDLFTSDFGARLDEYVKRRNKLVHGFFVEHFHDKKDFQLDSPVGKEYADYCGWLIEEGAKLIEVGFAIYYTIGLEFQKQGVADSNLSQLINDFKEYHDLGFSILKEDSVMLSPDLKLAFQELRELKKKIE